MQDTEFQLLKEKVQALSKKLETGETQLQACSKRKLQLEGDLAKVQQNHEFAQKYTNMLEEDKTIFRQKLEQREKQIERLQSKHLEYERTIRDLEVKLAGASASLEDQQKLKRKLKRIKEQKQNLVHDIESNKREIDRLHEKKDELKQKLDKRTRHFSDSESQLKLKNDEAKQQLEHLKVENDKLLEQLKKQEKATDAAIMSYGMSQEMERMDKALMEKEAHIQELEREGTYMNTSRVGLREEMEAMEEEMGAMEEEIRMLKGKLQGQHRGPLPKDRSPPQAVGLATAATGSSLMHHPPEDKLVSDNNSCRKSCNPVIVIMAWYITLHIQSCEECSRYIWK